MTITFAQVTYIESIRRKIETLQERLGQQAVVRRFGYLDPNDKWLPLPFETTAPLRETLCKITVTEILELLSEAEKMGVDITASKVALADFMEGMKKGDELCVGTDFP